MSDLPTQGSYTLFSISQLALVHKLSLLVPPSILIGFRDRSRFMFTDVSTNIVQVSKQPFLTQEEASRFMMKRMQPLHYLTPTTKPVITPRYVLKIIETDGSTQVYIYYCHQTLLSDVMQYWGYQDVIIQKFICQKSNKPSIARFYANFQTVFKAESCTSTFVAIKDNTDFMIRIADSSKQVLSEKERDDKIQNGGENAIIKSLTKALTSTTSKFGLSSHSNASGKQPTSTKSTDRPTQHASFINKLYALIQMQFQMEELEAQWTVRKDNEIKPLKPLTTVVNCRPAAFGSTGDSVLEITQMFANKFISSHRQGPLKSIVIEFIEGETGAYYFSKISSFKTLGVQDYQKEWQISIKYESKIKEFDTVVAECRANLLCGTYENYEAIKMMFKQKAVQFKKWQFNELEEGSVKVESRLLYLYRLEQLMAKDSFTLESEKARINPFHPLLGFPDKMHIDYPIYEMQKQTAFDVLARLKQDNLYRSHHGSYTGKLQKTKSKDALTDFSSLMISSMGTKNPTSSNKMTKTQSLVIQAGPRRLGPQINLPQYQSNVAVDEFGKIIAITSNQVDSCFHCAQLLNIYRQRHRTIIFTPDTVKEQLKRLKAKQSRNWDDLATVVLFGIYQNNITGTQQQPTSDDILKLHKRQQILLRIGRPESVASSSRYTESTNAKIELIAEERKRIKFQAALKKIARFRNDPQRITERDREDFLEGPLEQVEHHMSQLDSVKNFSSSQKSVKNKFASTNSETDRKSNHSFNSFRSSKSKLTNKLLTLKLHDTVDQITQSLNLMSTRSAEDGSRFTVDRFFRRRQTVQPSEIKPIYERLRRPKTSKQNREEAYKDIQQPIEVDPKQPIIIEVKKEPVKKIFRLRMKRSEHGSIAKSVLSNASRLVVDQNFQKSPYVGSFLDFGYVLKQVKSLKPSNSQKVVRKDDRILPLPKQKVGKKRDKPKIPLPQKTPF